MFVYDTFAEFEVSILITCLKGSGIQLETFSINNDRQVTSTGNLKILADHFIEKIDSHEYDALVIPGGEPFPLLHNEKLISTIKEFYFNKKIIAAICGGPALLGTAGILDEVKYTASLTEDDEKYLSVLNWSNKKNDYLVNDRNVITATGSNYLKFAEEVLRALGTISKGEIDPLQYFSIPSSN